MRKHCALFCLILITCILQAADETTYYSNIQHIISTNCFPCHQKNNAAPFALETYADVTTHISTIKKVVTNRTMPPWSADATYKHFMNERIMSNEDIITIRKWIDNKYPKGNVQADTAILPKLILGKPDLVIKLPKVKLPANNTDTIIHYKINYSISNDTTAYAICFVAGNVRMVHHANPILYNATGPDYFEELSNNLQAEVMHEDGSVSAERFYERNMNFFADYTPGRSLQIMPEGFSFNVSKQGYILCQVHYGPSAIAYEDQSSVEIYFDTKKAGRVGEARKLGSSGGIAKVHPKLVIPADSVQTYYIDFLVPMDASLIIYSGHMHLLGKKFLAYAVTPTYDTIPLLKINDYNFYLQEDCIPQYPIVLKRGYRIHVEAAYDNTSSNILNPNLPPVTVYEGWKTTDEMMAFAMYLVKYLPGDEQLHLGKPPVKH